MSVSTVVNPISRVKDEQNLQCHIQSVHPEFHSKLTHDRTPIECKNCMMKYSSKRDLKQHKNVDHNGDRKSDTNGLKSAPTHGTGPNIKKNLTSKNEPESDEKSQDVKKRQDIMKFPGSSVLKCMFSDEDEVSVTQGSHL